MSNDLSNPILREIRLKNGQQVMLRKPIIEDAKKMIEYLNTIGGESDNLLFGKDEIRITVEQEMEYIQNMNNDENTLMILGIIDDNIMSISHISSPNRKRIAHNSEISISVKKDYWKNGMGSAVMKELIRFAQKRGTIKNISLGVKSSNRNAIMLYEKFGFKPIGIHRNYFNVEGDLDDEILMDLSI